MCPVLHLKTVLFLQGILIVILMMFLLRIAVVI